MRKLLSILLCLTLATYSFSAVSVAGSATQCLQFANAGTGINFGGGTTFYSWVKLTDVTNLSYFVSVPGAGAYGLADTGNCTGVHMFFIKFASTVICSTIAAPSANVWVFEAAVINNGNTSIHFFHMTAAGSTTTADVSNSTAISSSTSGPDIGSSNATCSFPLRGSIANAGIFQAALSDAELKTVAYNGAAAVGRAKLAYWPLFFSNASLVADSDAIAGPVAVTGVTHAVRVVSGGAASKVDHCPCGDPF